MSAWADVPGQRREAPPLDTSTPIREPGGAVAPVVSDWADVPGQGVRRSTTSRTAFGLPRLPSLGDVGSAFTAGLQNVPLLGSLSREAAATMAAAETNPADIPGTADMLSRRLQSENAAAQAKVPAAGTAGELLSSLVTPIPGVGPAVKGAGLLSRVAARLPEALGLGAVSAADTALQGGGAGETALHGAVPAALLSSMPVVGAGFGRAADTAAGKAVGATVKGAYKALKGYGERVIGDAPGALAGALRDAGIVGGIRGQAGVTAGAERARDKASGAIGDLITQAGGRELGADEAEAALRAGIGPGAVGIPEAQRPVDKLAGLLRQGGAPAEGIPVPRHVQEYVDMLGRNPTPGNAGQAEDILSKYGYVPEKPPDPLTHQRLQTILSSQARPNELARNNLRGGLAPASMADVTQLEGTSALRGFQGAQLERDLPGAGAQFKQARRDMALADLVERISEDQSFRTGAQNPSGLLGHIQAGAGATMAAAGAPVLGGALVAKGLFGKPTAALRANMAVSRNLAGQAAVEGPTPGILGRLGLTVGGGETHDQQTRAEAENEARRATHEGVH